MLIHTYIFASFGGIWLRVLLLWIPVYTHSNTCIHALSSIIFSSAFCCCCDVVCHLFGCVNALGSNINQYVMCSVACECDDILVAVALRKTNDVYIFSNKTNSRQTDDKYTCVSTMRFFSPHTVRIMSILYI